MCNVILLIDSTVLIRLLNMFDICFMRFRYRVGCLYASCSRFRFACVVREDEKKKKKNRHAKRYHNICEDIFEKKKFNSDKSREKNISNKDIY